MIGAYGRGPRPHISATGEDAVLLKDTSHVVLRGLDVSNRGSAEARRRGVHVVATTGVMRDVTVRGMRIHDVQGDLAKDAGGSGGIQVDVLGPSPTHFDDLLIERNVIEDVSRSGIFIVGTTDPGPRPRAGQPWPAASTRVRVRANRLRRLGGDGIVPLGTVGAVVERNVVSRGNLRGRGLSDPAGMICNAGIWTFHANGTVIQRNEVFGMRFNGCDGTGFDVDYDQDGTVIQFNYSHDNEGGFVLLCTDADPRAADVRFNLSVDDRFAANQSPCSLRAGATYSGLRYFNNTVVGSGLSWGILGNPHHRAAGPGRAGTAQQRVPRPPRPVRGPQLPHPLLRQPLVGPAARGRRGAGRRPAASRPRPPGPGAHPGGARLPPPPRVAGGPVGHPHRTIAAHGLLRRPSHRAASTRLRPALAAPERSWAATWGPNWRFGRPKVCAISEGGSSPPQGGTIRGRATKGRHRIDAC